MVPRSLMAVLLAAAGLACRDKGAPPVDASSDGPRSDTPSPLTLAIAVTGCASYDAATARCLGAAPLTLSFAPVGSPELTQFLWSFGDGTPTTTERAPSHTFAHPDTYEVTLTGGAPDLGMVTPPRPLEVVVDRLALGAICDVDGQCESGLACLCAPGTGCSPAFVHGVCSTTCAAGGCGTNSVCAALPIGPPSDAGSAGHTPLCVAACGANPQGCAAGFVCQTLPVPASSGSDAWTRGCLPLGAVTDLGGACRDAGGALADAACTTGFCANVGALGVCTAACDDGHPCPDQATCALLSDGRRLCLLTCAANGDCGRDPLLACVPVRRSADAGTDVSACAPKGCTSDGVCSSSGRCGPDGFCVLR